MSQIDRLRGKPRCMLAVSDSMYVAEHTYRSSWNVLLNSQQWKQIRTLDIILAPAAHAVLHY